MGNQQFYKSSGGFTGYLYETISKKVTIDGITGKMVKLKADSDGTHKGLPQYADTSDVYFKKGKDGYANQCRVYIDRRMTIDFDWGHNHKNKDGSHFQMGTIHVQVYLKNAKGQFVRNSKNARLMTDAEIRKYGSIIKYFAPNVKFK